MGGTCGAGPPLDVSTESLYNQNAPASGKALRDRRELPVWISKGKYLYQNRADWITRAWLLIRKVINQSNEPTANDVRTARILIRVAAVLRPPRRTAPQHLLGMLEEVIINGLFLFMQPCLFCLVEAEEGVGTPLGGVPGC